MAQGSMRADGFADQRGVALPMAMIALLLLSSLTIAFAMLARSEPVIANNHLRVTQARALADSGLERAIWALSNPTEPGGVAEPLPVPIPPPYDGTFVQVNAVGGFQVTVTPHADENRRNVVSVGWVPNPDPADPRTKAHRRITATVERLRNLGLDAPCALCVHGTLEVAGTSFIDGRPSVAAGNNQCGPKLGTVSSGDTIITGAAKIFGADGNNDANEPTDLETNRDPASFDAFLLAHADLDTLKALAKRNGTYFQGSHTFNAGNKLKDGIVFIDTVSGQNITDDTPDADFASVNIHGNHSPDMQVGFNGMIVVNGQLNISGNVRLNGLVYAVNDLSYTGTGTALVEGLVISQNIRDTQQSTVDSNTGGNSTIVFDCAKASAAGTAPDGWLLTAGTYREVADP